MSDKSATKRAASPGSQYVVVTTTYPTTYGCNRGMNWSQDDIIARSSRTRSEETYSSRSEAIRAARKERNCNDMFTDACEPDSDYEHSDDEDAIDSGNFLFTNTDKPPYDSADLENYDNDDEVMIDVWTLDEYDAREADDAAFLRREGMRRQYEAIVRQKVMELQVKDSGRVHYSTPPQPFDIKAELEVVEGDAMDEDMEAKQKTKKDEKKSGAVPADPDKSIVKPVDIPSNASTVKTLMYRGGKGGLGKFTSECRRVDVDEDDGVAAAEEEELENVGLLRVLRSCTSLEELHLQNEGYWPTISPAFVAKILSAAPHLCKSLKVLSLGLSQIDPDALHLIGQFKMLQRLDISNGFSVEYYQDRYDDYDDDYGYGFSSKKRALPYDEPLMEFIDSLQHLKRIDLGNGDGESQRYLYDYMVSRKVVIAIAMCLDDRGGALTMENSNVPEPWSSEQRAKAARCQALVAIMEDDNEDKDVRAMAEEEAKICPACSKAAKKRCTGCKRQWYCSQDCQKEDRKGHKKICGERFS